MDMNIQLLDILICRTPAFSTQDELKERWEQLKEIIRETSPVFYQIICNLTPDDLRKSNTKIDYSVWKYFNRARYRATPYHNFAAFSLLPILKDEAIQPILDENMLSHTFISWNANGHFVEDIPLLLKSSNWFHSNTTIYTLGENHRYIRIKDGVFEIATVSGFPELNALLKLCREKTDKKTIYEVMKADFNLREKAINNLLLQMLSLHLFLTEGCPNITGADYFKRNSIKNLDSSNAYVISERKLVSGGLGIKKMKNIAEMIGFLAQYLPADTNKALEGFRLAFLKKFEHRFIPLTVAMDPEVGIGYDNLGEQQTVHQVIDLINMSGREQQRGLHIPYTELHRFLLNKLIEGAVIQLEEFKGTPSTPEIHLPNTLSVLFHFWQGQPVIKNAGGCTANALLGRFTLASEELEEYGRRIAAIEEQANPDILFFDIAYQAEKNVDNVNRRKQLYRHELPILSWSNDVSPIRLDDILVSVRGTEIILWSNKHQKRMVPRVPSAYNHNRSDLAVFRFLCDMQYHQVKSDLNFNLPYFFPDLHFYPRVTFKNLIVSPAMWQIPLEITSAAKSGELKNAKARLVNWLSGQGINDLFKAGHGDQMLCFDPGSDGDLEAFLLYCRQNILKEIYISEALISDDDGVSDNRGKKYVAEFLASYSHGNQVYKSVELPHAEVDYQHGCDQAIFPGGEWLYFEIYCHPAKADHILLGHVTGLLTENKNKILKWFFIRYDDPRPHIRLRLHIKDVGYGYPIISRLCVLLEPYAKIGQIQDIQLKTYFQESARYGVSRIELVEWFFFADSKYALRLLAKTKDNRDLYVTTLITMQIFMALVLPDINDQITFCKNIANRFSMEMGINNASFKKLNQYFHELKVHANPDINSSTLRLPTQLKKAFLAVFSIDNTKMGRQKLLADLLHMHVNRLFNADQRAHEAVLYHYHVKSLMTRRAFLTVPAEC
jgi:thiopeptide-type bacteriocin biosynthesis protein